ncbi:hypothetical protein FOMPIDRAFT_94949 [Fomitopsis schrenkii]|uniref:Uncharacterized protein n=1 Tax=Fomitopsis schrenkii TaxID=2126942 RepID=S8E176_FOMSC|nr:hypothetical protein FOMPIDRAFT_94949 [Fomitopsis schrenkii]
MVARLMVGDERAKRAMRAGVAARLLSAWCGTSAMDHAATCFRKVYLLPSAFLIDGTPPRPPYGDSVRSTVREEYRSASSGPPRETEVNDTCLVTTR